MSKPQRGLFCAVPPKELMASDVSFTPSIPRKMERHTANKEAFFQVLAKSASEAELIASA